MSISGLLRDVVARGLKLFAAGIGGVRGGAAWSISILHGLAAGALSCVFSAIATVLGWSPVLMRLVALSAKLAFIAFPLATVLVLVVCALANPFVRQKLDYAHDRSSATEVFDVDGRWIGIMPPASFADWSDGSLLPPDHAAVPPASIPPVWRTCIAYLEDRSAFDGISNQLGFNPAAFVMSGLQTLFWDRRRGASTLLMQVVRTLEGQSPDPHEPLGAVALRKVAELVGATSLARMLHDRDPNLVARYIAMHLPLMIGAKGSGFGDEIAGIELASRVLFDKSAAALPPEEQAILAAAVKAPIVLAPPGDKSGRQLALARWARIKTRAEYCLDHAFASGSVDSAAARARLADLALPSPSAQPAMAALLPADRREAWKIVVNPVRRALYFARQELRLAKTELDTAFKTDWRGKVVAIRLTTSAADSRTFADEITLGLRSLQARVPGLTFDIGDPQSSTAADVVVALADEKGHLRRFYSSAQGLFLTRKTEIGSTAKMIAAVVLSRRTGPRTAYCRAPTSEALCPEHSQWLAARDVFARSVSPAVEWALRRYAKGEEMERTAGAFGLPDFGGVPPATALSKGIVELTPAEMMRMTAAVGEVISGRFADVPLPSVIGEATILGADGATRQQLISVGTSLGGDGLKAVVPAQAQSFLMNVLAATSDPGGTLSSLASFKTALGGALYAKTGTVSVRGNTLALQISGVFMHAGRPWSFSVLIATPDNRRALGRNLAAGQFASLIRLLLHRLVPGSVVDDPGAQFAIKDNL